MFNSAWYQSLNTPPLNPPAGIFSPVWIVLYLTLFVSLIIYTTTRNNYHLKGKGYLFFFVQLGLNLLWSPVFFVFKSIPVALVIILLLDLFVFLTIKEFNKTSKLAGGLLIPYFIWVLFATYLNLGFFILN